jgi:hypothetical protein
MSKVFAIDVGYGNTKVVFDPPFNLPGAQVNKNFHEFSFRSVAPLILSSDNIQKVGINALDRVAVQVGDSRYWVGPESTGVDPFPRTVRGS